MTQIAGAAWRTREALYKALPPGAQPRFDTIARVCTALGLFTRKSPPSPTDFGARLLMQLPLDADEAVRRAIVGFVIHIWNAHVLAMPQWGRPEFPAQTRQ
jgi:hypothetical protein